MSEDKQVELALSCLVRVASALERIAGALESSAVDNEIARYLMKVNKYKKEIEAAISDKS
jgi:hypothetical protein